MPTFCIVAWEIYLPALKGFHLCTHLTASYSAFPPCLPKSRAALSPPCKVSGITPEGGRGDTFSQPSTALVLTLTQHQRHFIPRHNRPIAPEAVHGSTKPAVHLQLFIRSIIISTLQGPGFPRTHRLAPGSLQNRDMLSILISSPPSSQSATLVSQGIIIIAHPGTYTYD